MLCALVGLAVAACGGGGVKDVTGAASTTTIAGAPAETSAGPSFRPHFVGSACPSGVPHVTRIRCGWLVVREDRSASRGPTVRLPVAIVRGTAATPSLDPVVYLSGGPGQSGLAGIEGFLDQHYSGPRDTIVFDQRGTGGALPNLNCPEVEAAVKATFATTDPASVEDRAVVAGFGACRRRLVGAGVELAAFRTETSADDVDDLREALGYRQVNLYGASYGSALALTVLRRHPGGLRSVTLDGVYPTTIANGPAEVAANAQRAITALEAGCAAVPACHGRAPDLAGSLRAVVARFDGTPYVASLTDPATGDPVPVRLTGADIVAGVVDAMYQPSGITALPAALTALAKGDDSSIAGVASQGLTTLTGLSEGMAASVECADRARTPTRGDLASVIRRAPEMGTLALIGDLTAVCPEWGVPSADPAFSTPVASAVPTLLLSGAYDPVTPPANATTAARDLRHAHLVVLAAGGHGAVFGTDCGARIFRSFLARPAGTPDTSCSDHPTSPWSS